MARDFPSVYQEFVYKTRYSRYLEDKNRRENWRETISRYFDFFKDHLKERCGWDMPHALYDELYNAVVGQEVMPSMRGLMTGGPALKRDEGAIYNCAYLPMDSLRSFDEELYTLMLGTGVGFSVEAHDVAKLPIIAPDFHESETTIVVKDSKLGWAKAFRELLSLLAAGQIPQIDYSKVRGAGSRLKTFGGRASGPEPLKELFEFSIKLFKAAAGRRFTQLEAHDLACMVANIVVVGGVRRAALISLSDLSDYQMALAKSGEWWNTAGYRRLANNSAVYEEKPPIGKFMREWVSLYESNSGERGIFSRDAARGVLKRSAEFRKRHFGESVATRTISHHRFGTNPCKSLDSTILTDKGYITFRQALAYDDLTVMTTNGWQKATKPFKTGSMRQVTRITMGDGSYIYGTGNHLQMKNDGSWVEIDDLRVGDVLQINKSRIHDLDTVDESEYNEGVMIGWLWGDGSVAYDDGHKHPTISFAIGENEFDYIESLEGIVGKESKPHHQKPDTCSTIKIRNKEFTDRVFSTGYQTDKNDLTWLYGKSASFKLGFIRAAFTTDGSPRKQNSCELYSMHRDALNVIQTILYEFGVKSVVTTHNKACVRGGRNNSTSFKVAVSFGQYLKIGFLTEYKNRLLQQRNYEARDYRPNVHNTIREIDRKWSVEDVYDITVHDDCHNFVDNGCVTHNCSEIILRPYEFCNLSEAIVRADDTVETLKRKVRLATIIGTFQSTLTKFKYINKTWQNNCEEERLLGVSLTGIFDNMLTNGRLGHDKLATALEELRREAIATNIEFAGILGIPVSAAITCVKPSGTVSALNGTASGIHARHSEYYYRHVRNDVKDPVTQFMIDQGVPHEEDVYDPKNMVTFKFPMKSPDGAVVRTELSAIEHLEVWKAYQMYWCEHKPSVTINVRESEWMDVGAWVFKNFEWMSGVSFLPMSDHIYAQAPFEDCTKEQYEELLARTPQSIDWSLLPLYEMEDTTTGVQELSCQAGGCEL